MTGWRVALLALAVVLVGGAGGISAVDRRSHDRTPVATDVAAGDESTTTSSTVVESTTTTSTTIAATTSTTSRRSTTTTSRRTTTTRPPAGSTTTAGPPTTAPPGVKLCTPAELVASIDTDRDSYTPAQAVKVTTTLRNRSSTTCFYNGYGFKIDYKNDAGTSFGAVHLIADSFRDVPLGPGETLTQTPTWDHQACEPGCRPLPPGAYLATASWMLGGNTYDVWTSLILS